MGRTLRFGFFSTILLSVTLVTNAQNDRFAYAITDVTKEGAGWNALRMLDLQTGKYSNILLNGTDQKSVVFDAATNKQLTQKADVKYGNLLHSPFSTGVAAVAYDKKNNRLYYTPMFIDQLRYIDLKTMKVFYVDQPFTELGTMHNDEGKIVTRMVIAPDGNGYAITNDGNSLIKFTTGKKMKVTQLGSLVDDPSNNGISIHNRCSSFGGDMIADDRGNLYIISARNHVFKVNTETKVATHLAQIQGLPAAFTVNGAVVDADGALLVSSAVDGSSYFTVNVQTWKASPYETATEIFKSSDLANSNFLSTSSKNSEIELIDRTQSNKNNFIQVYPNPVTTNRFNLQFNKVPAGDYTLELTDVMGRRVFHKQINIGYEYQVQQVSISANNAKGVYLVKLTDKGSTQVYEQKLVIQ